MDPRLDRLEDKIDKLIDKVENTNDRLVGVEKELVVYNNQLEIHIKATNENRDSIKNVDVRVETLEEKSKFISSVILFLKITGAFATFILGVALALKELGIV